MDFRFKRIGDRIIILVGISVFAGLFWISNFHTKKQVESILDQHEQTLYMLTRSVHQGLEAIMLAGNAEIASKYAENLKKIKEIKSFTIIRNSGLEAFKDNETITDVNTRIGEEEFNQREKETQERILDANDPDLQQALTKKTQVIKKTIDPASQIPYLTVLSPIPNQKSCHRCHGSRTLVRGLVQLTFSMAAAEEEIEEIRSHSQIILWSTLAGVLMLTLLLIRHSVVRPIRKVTEAMKEVSSGNLHHRVPETSQDELGQMAKMFNQMSDELAKVLVGLKNEQEKLTTIILSAKEGIVITDRQNKVVLANPAAERLLEKTQEKIIEEGFLHILDDPE
ncbi:MAG: HAMP domain-containing protein, partial [Magnetococcales bacterium]|nr:HAMP domain-containing protein [Magnetococcales bacterium]